MNITKDTTQDEIWAPVKRAMAQVAKAAEDGQRAEVIAGILIDAAMAEGAAHIYDAYRSMFQVRLEEGVPGAAARAEAKDAVTNLLLQSPDDTWAGRRNDIRRAYNDGQRQATARLVRGY